MKIIYSIPGLVLHFMILSAAFAGSNGGDSIPELEAGSETYQNPIIPGFNPDPSICRVGNDFYLATSSFEYFPGVPIYHSTDLVNWELTGHALSRPSQLDLKGFKCSLGIFAPTLRYHEGLFYMVTTIVGPRYGNFIVTAKDPAGPWSEPHWIRGAPGIDPSLFFDDDGRVYMTGNLTPKERAWNGHNDIWLQELDTERWELIGERTIILDGAEYHNKGTRLDEGHESWLNAIEASHIYKRKGYYYHLFAHGGTGHNHAVAIMRSKHIHGPYELDPSSPILTHRDLSPTHPITTTGHADLVDTPEGNWWMVYLGKRPNDGERFMLGRETFLSPVDWSGDWPIVNPGRRKGRSELVQLKPEGLTPGPNNVGNFRDDFSSLILNPHWTFKRTPHTTWWSLSDKAGYLSMKLRPEKISEIANPSFLGKRMAHFNFSATARMLFEAASEHEEAGLVIERDRDHYIKFTRSLSGGTPVLRIILKNGPEEEELSLDRTAVPPGEIQLRVRARGFLYRFSYSFDGREWTDMQKEVDCRENEFHRGGKWTGSFVGIYASSNGEQTKGEALFDFFDYRSMDTKKDQLPVSLYYESSEGPVSFAAGDLKDILEAKGIDVNLKDTRGLTAGEEACQLVLAVKESVKSSWPVSMAAVDTLKEQEYLFRVIQQGERKKILAIGGDPAGAMYAGIHLGEIVKAFGLDSVKNENHAPYIRKRGIKFNIPLDERNPSHDDRGTSAQSNVANMWDTQFWEEYLDELARQRYNVLSLWNQHPFPSMLKLEDYPDVALNDVYNKQGRVKEISIGQKIKLWQEVMEHAHQRGIEVYVVTWNIHMNGAEGKYGITEDFENLKTREYLRRSVEELFLTYPHLAGIGTTAGENMNNISDEDKEDWLWDTYGRAIMQVQEEQPERKITFIHRFWWTSFDKIESRFGQLRDGFDMSFKYARARMYSVYDPPFAEKELLPVLPEGISTWWNIRNDDIYNLRWGNAEYARQFILNLPKGDRTAGYYLGSDRFVWGRESISKTPGSPPVLENRKHWYSFLLWGRMGYDPETPVSLLKGLIRERFPTVPAEVLYEAWSVSSQIIPLVNTFHWFSWDYLWWPEAGISTGYGDAINGYHDVNDFIQAPVMDQSGLISIPDYVDALMQGSEPCGRGPLEVADSLERSARLAVDLVAGLGGSGDHELEQTIGDIRAMSHLGAYYGAKIQGATYLALYRETKKQEYRSLAVENLETALLSWQEYTAILDAQYHKMNIAMHGLFDWDAIEREVAADIAIAANAK